MSGEGRGPDGKPAKFKSTTEHKDKDTMVFTMNGVDSDGKELPMFTITYSRRQ